jgi:hypothetical protein
MRRTARAFALTVVVATAGCITLPVSTTVVARPGIRVTAEASKLNVLWLSPLAPETSADLVADLLEQCGREGLTGVTIGTQTAWVLIGQQENIVATGYCTG